MNSLRFSVNRSRVLTEQPLHPRQVSDDRVRTPWPRHQRSPSCNGRGGKWKHCFAELTNYRNFCYFACSRLHFLERVVIHSVLHRKQRAQMRCLRQNARTMPIGFLSVLVIGRSRKERRNSSIPTRLGIIAHDLVNKCKRRYRSR